MKKQKYLRLNGDEPVFDGFEVWVDGPGRARRAFELLSRLGFKFNEVVDGDGVSHLYFDYRPDALRAQDILANDERKAVKDTFRGMEGN